MDFRVMDRAYPKMRLEPIRDMVKSNHRMAATTQAVWQTRFCISQATARDLRRRLFLALLPEAFEFAGEQSAILGRQTCCESSSRSAGVQDASGKGVVRSAGLGA